MSDIDIFVHFLFFYFHWNERWSLLNSQTFIHWKQKTFQQNPKEVSQNIHISISVNGVCLLLRSKIDQKQFLSFYK